MVLQHPQPLELHRDPHEAAHARQHVAASCQGLLPDVAMNAQLMTSELVTNALDYGTGPITLTVMVTEERIRVEVSDGSTIRPVAQHPDATDIHGRGLLIIEHLAQSWGVEPSPTGRGKTVWFTLSTA